MSQIVIYDPNDAVVPNRVIEFVHSANTPDYDSEPNKLVNPDLSALSGVIVKFWKRSGSTVTEMSQGEKDAIAQAEVDALTASIRAGAKSNLDNFGDLSLFHRAFADIAKDEINILRAWTVSLKAAVAGASTLAQLKTAVAALDTLDDRTLDQLKTAIKNRCDDGSVDS